MMPVLTTRKRSSGFSIDSIMSTCGSRSDSSSERRVHPTCVSDARPTAEHTLSSYQQASPLVTHPVFPAAGMGLDNRLYCNSRLQLPTIDNPSAINANMRLFYNGLPHSGAVLAAANAGGYPGGCVQSQILAAQPPKEQYPFYTWLLARHGNYLNHTIQGAENSYLFPFRKQKRIRTAFSPSQLLHLEKSFERNHYVVGQERKDLAHDMSLTETQVKVWFQNRRTKYKRVQTEDDDSSTEQRSSDNETEDDNTSLVETSGKTPGEQSRHECEQSPRDCEHSRRECEQNPLECAESIRECDTSSESEYVDVDSPCPKVEQLALETQVT